MKKYENEELIEKADKVSEEILNSKGHTYIRDKFFPRLCDGLKFRTAVEIGVDKGDFSSHMLQKSKIERYYCVDPWPDNFGSEYRPEYFDEKGENRMQQAMDTLKDYKEEGRAVLIKEMSVDASNMFGNNSLDFCYIDGDHSLEGIYSDIVAWFPKMKVGGILAGHDYKDGRNSGIQDYSGEQLPYRIKTVVNDYCQRYGHKLNVVGGIIKSWWFVKNRDYENGVRIHYLNPRSLYKSHDVTDFYKED